MTEAVWRLEPWAADARFTKNPEETDNRIGSSHLPRGFYEIWGRLTKLVGQSLSALCTSSLENVATIRGLHSLSEAMLLLSLTLLRLVSSEHNRFYLLQDLLSGRNSAGLTGTEILYDPETGYRAHDIDCYIIPVMLGFVKGFLRFFFKKSDPVRNFVQNHLNKGDFIRIYRYC